MLHLEELLIAMYLFFDTETTGLPRNWKAPVADLGNWPRLVQLAWLQFDSSGNKIAERNSIVKPDNFTIPSDASQVHGITTDYALREGVPLQGVLEEFQNLISKSTYLVAHNMSFDEKIVGAEFLRKNMTNSITTKSRICTMEKSTNYCKLDGPYGYKWPKLSELHYALFGTGFEEAHNAAIDITITAKCFWELRNRKIL